MEEKKRGRPRKETALALVEPEAAVEAPEPVNLKRTRKKPEAAEAPVEVPEPVKLKRTRKKPDPETAISSDVSLNSARGAVTFTAMRAPPKQPKTEEKIEEQPQGYQRPYAYLHDRYSPYGHFAIA